MASSDNERRRELAEFLRARRERIAPRDVGLPAGGSRRRVAGLRREEVAILAGVSPTWYTYLEQGRSIQVSPQVLDSLSRVLALSEDERRYLHRLSYGYVAGALGTVSDRDDGYRSVLAAISSEWPVYVANAMCDLLAWNEASTDWYGDWAAGEASPNLLVWLVTDPGARQRLPEWELVGRDLVARCRAAIAHDPQTYRGRVEALQELMLDNAQLRSWWSRRDVSELRPTARIFDHPVHGRQHFDVQTFLSGVDAGIGIVFHVPSVPSVIPNAAELR